MLYMTKCGAATKKSKAPSVEKNRTEKRSKEPRCMRQRIVYAAMREYAR